jgi:hypothetical protein
MSRTSALTSASYFHRHQQLIGALTGSYARASLYRSDLYVTLPRSGLQGLYSARASFGVRPACTYYETPVFKRLRKQGIRTHEGHGPKAFLRESTGRHPGGILSADLPLIEMITANLDYKLNFGLLAGVHQRSIACPRLTAHLLFRRKETACSQHCVHAPVCVGGKGSAVACESARRLTQSSFIESRYTASRPLEFAIAGADQRRGLLSTCKSLWRKNHAHRPTI